MNSRAGGKRRACSLAPSVRAWQQGHFAEIEIIHVIQGFKSSVYSRGTDSQAMSWVTSWMWGHRFSISLLTQSSPS